MIKTSSWSWIAGGLISILLAAACPSRILASCEDDCQVPRSCKEYLECRTSYMECLAACKQKEAWELNAQASEKFIAATERMAQILEQTFQSSEKITLLLDKLITKMAQEKDSLNTPPEEPQQSQGNPVPAPRP